MADYLRSFAVAEELRRYPGAPSGHSGARAAVISWQNVEHKAV
jgi:hypothetical protein